MYRLPPLPTALLADHRLRLLSNPTKRNLGIRFRIIVLHPSRPQNPIENPYRMPALKLVENPHRIKLRKLIENPNFIRHRDPIENLHGLQLRKLSENPRLIRMQNLIQNQRPNRLQSPNPNPNLRATRKNIPGPEPYPEAPLGRENSTGSMWSMCAQIIFAFRNP